jgi:hypothetical protein
MAFVPFTLADLKQDPEDLGHVFDGAPDRSRVGARGRDRQFREPCLTRLLVTTTLVTRHLVRTETTMNPALLESAANERLSAMRRAAERSAVAHAADVAASQAGSRERRRGRMTSPSQAVGWLLVSIGLRLVVPRTPARPAR